MPSLAVGQQQQGPGLPIPRLLTVVPCGGKAGSTVELSFTGQDVEEPQALLFSHPGIKAEPVVPPAPPTDPKKPAPKPAPPPVITKFKVTIPADAPLGSHDVRLINKWGVSNPRAFVVGDLAEVLEKEPNNDVPEAQRLELNTTVNGTIVNPTDVDYCVFTGKKGQRVVISCLAWSIDSRMNAALEIYDSTNRKFADNRNYQGSYHANDALVDCTLPADGDYYVRLYQFTYTQGNAEHFYRLSVTTAPWIDAVFPPVVEPGKPAQLTVYGRNLPGGQPDPSARDEDRAILEKVTVTVNVPNDPAALQRLAYSGHLAPHASGLDGFEYRLRNAAGASNPFLLTYARAPVVLDSGANDTLETAQEITVPCEVAGRIEKLRDRDWYAFTAKKDAVYGIEVFGDRLGSPADMELVLHNLQTKQDLVTLDDNPEVLSAQQFSTRTADPPRYRFVVPADGKYHLQIKSQLAGNQAGPRHLYCVRIVPEQPDFRLIVMPHGNTTPDACVVRQGGRHYYDVFVWRLDGWNGDITLNVEGLPAGVTCPPQTVGTGLKQASLVVSAAPDAPAATAEIKVKGTATINGQKVVREARPATITWPTPQQQQVATISRLDRNLVLAVRDKAPYSLTASIDKTALLQGDKAVITLKLARLWPDFKTPLQIAAANQPPNNVTLPPNLTINNNQAITLAPGKDEITVPVVVNPNVLPGTYTLILRGTAQIPFNKDPMAKQKPNINIVQPSTPVTITVLPKQVATVTLATPNPTVKIGTQTEVVVKLARMYDYAGEFKLQLVLPPNAKGISADEVTIPAGKDEAKFIVKAASDAAPGNRPDLIVRATAMVNGTVPTTHDTKFNVNVVK